MAMKCSEFVYCFFWVVSLRYVDPWWENHWYADSGRASDDSSGGQTANASSFDAWNTSAIKHYAAQPVSLSQAASASMLGLRRLLVADLRCSSYLEIMRQLRLAPGDFRWHCHCCQWLQGGTLWEVGTFINLYKWLTYIFERSCFLQLGSWHLLLDHLGPSFFPCQELRPQGPKAPKDRTVGMISHD